MNTIKYIPIIKSIDGIIRSPDTARCVQGAVLVTKELLTSHGNALNIQTTRLSDHGKQLIKLTNSAISSTVISGQQDDTFAENREPRYSNEIIRTTELDGRLQSITPTINHTKNVVLETEQGTNDKSKSVASPAVATESENIKSFNNVMREAIVPATPVSRVFGFANLAVGLTIGSVKEAAKRASGQQSENNGDPPSIWLSPENSERLSASLCRMRGAALKLGQMLSIQDNTLLHPVLRDALERVRHGADYMPQEQLESAMSEEFGENWRMEKFSNFEDIPIAAASLGQVHKATLMDGTPVAVKVQYPGVAESIDSDVSNLRRLAKYTGIFPKGLYIDSIINVMQSELKEECNYLNEAKNQTEFRNLLSENEQFHIPKVFESHSTDKIITSEFCTGISLDQVSQLPQNKRNEIGRRLLKLTLNELFEFRFMQTDPNFSNFLYDPKSDTITLLDFGACARYGQDFVKEYLELVWAAANTNRDQLLESSLKLGMLTGKESEEMVHAHIEAGLIIGVPFLKNEAYDFGKSGVPTQTAKHGETFMRERLTPPPKEIYPLHRKLSGAYMTCIRIGASFPCRDLLEETYKRVNRS